MRFAKLGLLLALAAGLTGCLQATTVISVKPDGSGTIEQTMAMTTQAMQQFEMMASMGGEKGAAAKKQMFSEEDARKAATQMGEGVTFVSSQPIHTAQLEGMKATYAFTDITKIKVNQKPTGPAGGPPAGRGAGPRLMTSGPEDVLFRFAKAPMGNSTVTVVFPQIDAQAARKEAGRATGRGAGRGGSESMPPEALAMMSQFLKGLKISIILQPVGRIVKANTPFVEGQKVTLLEMDFDQLMTNPSAFEKLQGLESLEQAKTVLKDVKGVKFAPEREVTVEFAGK